MSKDFKKVSVTFNLKVDKRLTHKRLREFLKSKIDDDIVGYVEGTTGVNNTIMYVGRTTSMQINNVER